MAQCGGAENGEADLLLGNLARTRGAGVTEQVVEDFEVLTHTYRQLDYRQGARQLRIDLAAHLHRILEVSNRSTGAGAHRRLLRAAGDAAQLAAWFAIDGQNYRRARSYCQLAVSVAERANDRPLHAYSLGVVSYLYLHAGNGKEALGALEVARELAGRGVPAAVGSWLSEATGEAYGLLDQSHLGLTALAEAERAFDGVGADSTPVWLSFFNAECHAARLKGRCLTRLRRPRDPTRALYEALTLLPGTFVRERSGTLIDRQRPCRAQIGEPCHRRRSLVRVDLAHEVYRSRGERHVGGATPPV